MKVKIIGGLGNQMFQYATAYALSKKIDEELIVDISDAIKYKVHPLRLTELSCSSKFISKSFFYEKYIYNEIDYRIKRVIYPYCYIEKNLMFDSKLFNENIAKNKKIVGYFQCEKYFKAYRTELLSEFKPKSEYSDYQEHILREIMKGNSCSIHIRRGDYVTNSNANNVHGTCNEDYFIKALNHLSAGRNINEETTLFVFSDDIEWCKKNIKLPYKMLFVNGDDVRSELDMWLMSKCEHNIISNSTFSWWAAWLNNNHQKVVVAPKVWFKNGMDNEIVPDSWVKL